LKKIYLILIILSGNFLLAQDIHFSQFNLSYLNLNPALTGSFNGDYRFNQNFRNQWSSVSEPYRTFSFSIEGKSLIKKIPALHLGIVVFNDEAGLGGLQTTHANLSLAYSYGLNKDSTLIAKGGVQFGYAGRSINFDQFTFDNQYNGRRFDGSLDKGENFDQSSFSNFNLNSGFGLEYRYDVRKIYNIGFSLFNLTSPNQSFQGSNIPLDMRTTVNLSGDHIISDKMDIMPSILYSRQGEFNEVMIGTNLRYRFNGVNYLKKNLYGGVWYRNQDAIILSAGVDYYQWNVGLSYDINISELESASNNRGGLEIAITYIFTDFKPQIRRYKVCPNFM